VTFVLDMTFAEAVGSIGVFLLLVAFFMNLIGALEATTPAYIALNLFGAGLACYASYLIGFLPFVVLEGTWALVAALALGRLMFRRPHGAPGGNQ
jgi:hypothetical protein